MHTLKTVPISLCRHTYFETNFFYRRSTDYCSCLLQGHFWFVFLFNLHYTNLPMIMTKEHRPYKGRSINKLQNSVILLIFKI